MRRLFFEFARVPSIWPWAEIDLKFIPRKLRAFMMPLLYPVFYSHSADTANTRRESQKIGPQ